MLNIKTTGIVDGPEETYFEAREVADPKNGSYRAVIVHPWHRYKGSVDESFEVFVSVGHYNEDGTEQYVEGQCEPVWNIIVDREEFVEGLLASFPELTRKETK